MNESRSQIKFISSGQKLEIL